MIEGFVIDIIIEQLLFNVFYIKHLKKKSYNNKYLLIKFKLYLLIHQYIYKIDHK
jgi:hypothetical protein